jgi:translation initiation factor 1
LREGGLAVSPETSPVAAPPPSPKPVEDGAPDLSRSGQLVVRRERKGHGGKTVTVIDGLKLSVPQLETAARLLRKALGCGSRVDDGRIVLQGDLTSAAEAWLRARGASRVTRGN